MASHGGRRVDWVLPTVVALVAVLSLVVVVLLVSEADASKPVPPSDVSVEGAEGAVDLSFVAGSDGVGPQVYEVSLNRSSWLPLTVTPRDGRLTATVPDLLDGTSYDVRVRAVGAGGPSEPSVSTSASEATTEGEPVRVDVETRSADGQVALTFEEPDDARTLPAGWRVSAAPDDPSLAPRRTVCAAATDICVVRDLVEGEDYDLVVTPFASLLPGSVRLQTVAGAPIDLGRVTVAADAAAAGPDDLAAVPLDGALELGWTMPRGSVDERERFEVTVGPDARWTPLDTSEEGGRFSATVSGLDNGEETRVAVRVAGGSQPGAVATVEGTPAGPPSRVRGTEATARGTTATLRWRAPRDTGGATVRTYVVSGYDGPGCTTRRTTCTVRGIDPRRPVRFVISADNTTDGQPDTGLGPAVPVGIAGPRR